MKLKKKSVAKPWGQSVLPEPFRGKRKQKIGEIWFEPPEGITPSLMVKYLFTSEKLSIQVHPNDRQARRAGFPHGKEECWLILHAEPGAKLGIGLTNEVRPAKLEAAVACGQMENLLDWKPVETGDFFYIPAGTIHAIGPDIVLVEVQQNIDLTYRLYDYGRPRELHLEDAIKVAILKPYDLNNHSKIPLDQSAILTQGKYFGVFQAVKNDLDLIADVEATEWQIIPLEGNAKIRGTLVKPGECGICANKAEIDLSKNDKSIIAFTTTRAN